MSKTIKTEKIYPGPCCPHCKTDGNALKLLSYFLNTVEIDSKQRFPLYKDLYIETMEYSKKELIKWAENINNIVDLEKRNEILFRKF